MAWASGRSLTSEKKFLSTPASRRSTKVCTFMAVFVSWCCRNYYTSYCYHAAIVMGPIMALVSVYCRFNLFLVLFALVRNTTL